MLELYVLGESVRAVPLMVTTEDVVPTDGNAAIQGTVGTSDHVALPLTETLNCAVAAVDEPLCALREREVGLTVTSCALAMAAHSIGRNGTAKRGEKICRFNLFLQPGLSGRGANNLH